MNCLAKLFSKSSSLEDKVKTILSDDKEKPRRWELSYQLGARRRVGERPVTHENVTTCFLLRYGFDLKSSCAPRAVPADIKTVERIRIATIIIFSITSPVFDL